MKDREMATSMRRNNLPEPDDMIRSSIEAKEINSRAVCIYDNRNYGVGSVINNPDGSKYICSDDGTWQITK